jgi:hypothetical protein
MVGPRLGVEFDSKSNFDSKYHQLNLISNSLHHSVLEFLLLFLFSHDS